MTHNDIYVKFMIEYDKALITSSYPSLTKYEIATLLDKAYLALIAQKVVGNNPRNIPLEGDIKAIEDLRPLIKTNLLNSVGRGTASNEYKYNIPEDFLYYVSAVVNVNYNNTAIDKRQHDIQNVMVIDHDMAAGFRATSSNLPWIPTPALMFQGDDIHVFIDAYYGKNTTPGNLDLDLTYLKTPAKFVLPDTNVDFNPGTDFELSDTMAEELINLAIIMALEVVESTRLNTKAQTRTLES